MEKRLFLAIPIPAFSEFLAAQKRLEESLRDRKNIPHFTDPRDLHLTLHFFGLLEKYKIPEVQKIAQAIAQSEKSFAILPGRFDGFPNASSAKVFFCSVEENQPLLRMQTKLAHKIEESGFPQEAKTFVPHITLARLNPREGIARKILSSPTGPIQKISVDRFCLYESHGRLSVPRYSIIDSFPLGT